MRSSLRVIGLTGLRKRRSRRPSTRPTRREVGLAARGADADASRRATSSGRTSSRLPAQAVLDEEGIEGVRGPVLGVRHHRRPHDRERARGGLAANSGRVDRRHPERLARERHRVREGAAERPAPLDDDRDDDQGHVRSSRSRSGSRTPARARRCGSRSRSPSRSSPTRSSRPRRIPIIDPGETKAVTFQVGALVPFGEQITIKVDVDPVAGRDEHGEQLVRVPGHLHA